MALCLRQSLTEPRIRRFNQDRADVYAAIGHDAAMAAYE